MAVNHRERLFTLKMPLKLFFWWLYVSLMPSNCCVLHSYVQLLLSQVISQENPARANGHIFNVGNPNNEVTVRQLAEMMSQVSSKSFSKEILYYFLLSVKALLLKISSFNTWLQVYTKVSGEPSLDTPTVDISSKEFYGEGYDDSDKRIPDMTIINRQLGKE